VKHGGSSHIQQLFRGADSEEGVSSGQLFVHTQTELTCADSDRLHKLFPPGVCADNQRQVGLLNELVNSALQIRNTAHLISNQLQSRTGDRVAQVRPLLSCWVMLQNLISLVLMPICVFFSLKSSK